MNCGKFEALLLHACGIYSQECPFLGVIILCMHGGNTRYVQTQFVYVVVVSVVVSAQFATLSTNTMLLAMVVLSG